MQTYIFTIAVNGDDVQDSARDLRDQIIDLAQKESNTDGFDVHVTEAVRVTL